MAASIAAPQMHRDFFAFVRIIQSCWGAVPVIETGEHDIARVARYSAEYKKSGVETSQVMPMVSE